MYIIIPCPSRSAPTCKSRGNSPTGPQGSVNSVRWNTACVRPSAWVRPHSIKLAPDSDCPAGKCTSPKLWRCVHGASGSPGEKTATPSQGYENQVENAGCGGQEATSVPINGKVGKWSMVGAGQATAGDTLQVYTATWNWSYRHCVEWTRVKRIYSTQSLKYHVSFFLPTSFHHP